MDVKVIQVFNNQRTFENIIMDMMTKGYKVHSSTIMPNTIGMKTSFNLIEQKVIYYALMIKE